MAGEIGKWVHFLSFHANNVARVGDDAGNGGGGGGKRAGQEGAAALALPAFEVAVAGADGILARLKLVAVHGDAHAAAGLAPFGAGFREDLVQTFGFGLALDACRAGHNQHAHAVGCTWRPCIKSAAWRRSVMRRVGAAADEDHIDPVAQQRLSGLQGHVGQRFLQRRPLFGVGDDAGRVPAGDGHAHAGVGAVGDHRLQRVGMERDGADRTSLLRQLAARANSPAAASQSAPCGATGDRRCIQKWCHRARPARPAHRLQCSYCRASCGLPSQAADGRAAVFEHMARAAADADLWR